MYFDRNATTSGAQRRTAGGGPERRGARPSSPGGGPATLGISTETQRRAARSTRFSRDGSPAEPPPGELGHAGFITGCLAGMDRRPSPHRENWAAWVSSPVVWPGWIAGRAPTGRTGPRGFHYRLFGRDGSPAEPPPGELGRVGSTTGCLAGMDRRTNAARLCLRAAQLVRLTTAASRPWTGVAGPSSPGRGSRGTAVRGSSVVK